MKIIVNMRKHKRLVSELAAEWLDNIEGMVATNTYLTYESNVRNHILPKLGNIKVCKLELSTLQDFAKDLRKDLAITSVRLVIAILNNILEYAQERNYIKVNKCKRLIKLKSRQNKITIFNISEQKKIEQLISVTKDRREIGILLALYTGLRLGEVCALKWEDVDLKNSLIKVKASLKRNIYQNKNCIKQQESPSSKSRVKIIIEERGTKSENGIREIPIPT